MRWAPDARERLARAAFELFAEQGYAETTVPQITARAGLTTRTFFRHFADKREVIFRGDEIPEEAAAMIRSAPADTAPGDVIRTVLHRVAAERFDGRKTETASWRRLIEDTDSLRDRDARKRADLVRAVTDAFVARGLPPAVAALHAETGALVFHVALDRWVTEPSTRPLTEVIDEVLRQLRSSLG